MANTHQRRWFTYWLIASFLAILTGCSPNFHKQDADKEVYKIIDSKWQPSFGLKVNYVISDANSISTPNDVNIDKHSIVGYLDKPVTLAQAVALATQYNRDYQTQKERLYLSALDLTGERYKYAVKWFATVDFDYTSTPEITTIDREERDFGETRIVRDEEVRRNDETRASSEFGVSKTFITPEGIIAHSALTFNWVRFLTGDPRTTLASILTGDIIVPLLGSGGGKVDWENLTQTERDVLYQVREFNRFRQSFVVSIINDYYQVLRQKDSATNAKNNWNSSIEARKQAAMEARTGRIAPFEVDQAKQREFVSYNGYILATQTYEQVLDTFKIRLTIPANVSLELDQNELMALREIPITEPQFSSDSAIETSLLRRLDLANAADSIDDALRKAKLAAEGLGPQIDLTAEATVPSTPETEAARLQFHRGIYSAAIEADLPLDRKNQRNAYRTALITLDQTQRDYDDAVDFVMRDVRQSYRQLVSTADLYVIQQKALSLAEERVRNMPLLLKSGRAQVRDLLDAQDSLLQSQNDLTSALVGHTIAKLNFYRDVGILQVKPDGMWAQPETVTGKAPNERKQNKQSTDNL